jgi:hypothetical protein
VLTIAEVKNLQDGAVVDAVQVTVGKAYERRSWDTANGPTTVQNVELTSASGSEKIRAAFWGHPDVAPLQGQTFVLHSSKGGNGRFGGVTVKHGSYTAKTGPKQGQTIPTVELSVNKSGQLQHLQVYAQQNGLPQQSQTQAAPAAAVPQNLRNGQQVGNALNLAVQVLVESGMVRNYQPSTVRAKLPKDLALIASDILRVSDWLGEGHLAPAAKETAKESLPAALSDEHINRAVEAGQRFVQQVKNETTNPPPPPSTQGQDDDLPF